MYGVHSTSEVACHSMELVQKKVPVRHLATCTQNRTVLGGDGGDLIPAHSPWGSLVLERPVSLERCPPRGSRERIQTIAGPASQGQNRGAQPEAASFPNRSGELLSLACLWKKEVDNLKSVGCSCQIPLETFAPAADGGVSPERRLCPE